MTGSSSLLPIVVDAVTKSQRGVTFVGLIRIILMCDTFDAVGFMPSSNVRRCATVRMASCSKCRGEEAWCLICSTRMQRLTQAPNLAIATLWADALEREGIGTSLQRTFLTGGAGDLPPDQCLPEIWITEPAQHDRARELLHAMQNIPQRRWGCACGELIEGGFEQCWNCGALMPR